MKNAKLKNLLAAALLAASASPALATGDDGIGDAITSMGGLATSVGGGAAAVIAVAVVFVTIKLGKRLLGKV